MKNSNTFLVARQYDSKGSRTFWLHSDINEYFKALSSKTDYFKEKFPHFFEVIPDVRNVKIYVDVE